MGSWQTCVRARTQVRALILTVKDLKDLVTRKPAAEVELRAGQSSELTCMYMLVKPFGSMLSKFLLFARQMRCWSLLLTWQLLHCVCYKEMHVLWKSRMVHRPSQTQGVKSYFRKSPAEIG